jgi:hypothetical protein
MRNIEIKSEEFELLCDKMNWNEVEEVVTREQKQGNSMWSYLELHFEVEGKKYIIKASRCTDNGFEETWFDDCYEVE